jgi:hypothetical protein
VEDRLSPDANKYGSLDRSPFIAEGSGTFSYYMLYPLDPDEVSSELPIMDVYINGQHFPFSTASYVQNKLLTQPTCSGTAQSPVAAQEQCQQGGKTAQQCQAAAQAQCLTNQCFRDQRSWVSQGGKSVRENQFESVVSVPFTDTSQQMANAEAANASAIFSKLVDTGVIDPNTVIGSELVVSPTNLSSGTLGTHYKITGGKSGDLASPVSSISLSNFTAWFTTAYPGGSISQVTNVLNGSHKQYKLFYTLMPNGIPQFVTTPPTTCSGTNNALCSTVTATDINGNPHTNTNGDMQFDLFRTGDYAAVDAKFPEVSSCLTSSSNLRCNIAWQWAASQGTDASSIGLDVGNNQYPTYDINGSLKEVTIFGIDTNQDGTIVSYEDPSGGDIDLSWDANSCGPKPGLQTNADIFTFTQNGTYLKIKEGKLYNPETDLFVRSANKRDSIDLVQRQVQLSNNTYRFCGQFENSIMPSVGAFCSNGSQTATCPNGSFCTPPTCGGTSSLSGKACIPGDVCQGRCTTVSEGRNSTVTCEQDTICSNPCEGKCPAGAPNCTPVCTPNTSNCLVSLMVPNADAAPNPVEVCVNGSSSTCFTGDNIKKTCFDASDNMLFVRSRLEDRRGRFWMTDTSGQLKVQ